MQYLFLFLFIALGGYPCELSIDKGIVIEGTATISSIACIKKQSQTQLVIGVAEENRGYIFTRQGKGSYSLSEADTKVYGKDGDGRQTHERFATHG
ncbi:MAG: hypothetical protein AAB267_00455, partial [Candidatus Desantisbacteria bacterium]